MLVPNQKSLALINSDNNIEEIDLITKKMNVNQIKTLSTNCLLSNTRVNPIFKIDEENKAAKLEDKSETTSRSEDEEDDLNWREFEQKLTKDQIKLIRSKLNQNRLSIKQLSWKYRLSLSTIYKIKKKYEQ